MSRRLYLGRLPPDARSDEVQAFFNGYGKITDCRVMSGFGFIEFETPRDADDVVRNFNGKTFQGSNIIVEFAKEARGRRENYDSAPPRSRRPPGVRVIVSGISRDTSWQDLKDFAREAGSVSFADIDREVQGQGIIEYTSRDDAERAVKTLEGKDLRGQPVRVALSEDRGPDQYRRDDRRGGGGGDRSSRYDREDREYRGPPREERYGSRGGPTGRDRSRSPGRGRGGGEYERGGHPQRYEDRRGGEYEDRRGAPAEAAHGRRREERRDDRARADPAYGEARQSGGW